MAAIAQIIAQLQVFDREGTGRLPSGVLEQVLLQLGLDCSEADAAALLHSSGAVEQGSVRYRDFVSWVLQQTQHEPEPAKWLDGAAERQLLDISSSLLDMASAVRAGQPCDPEMLVSHAASLRAMLREPAAAASELLAHRGRPAEQAVWAHPPLDERMERMPSKPMIAQYRAAAARIAERTGARGEMVDDLVEVDLGEVADKHAISHWRMCSNLRLYRSETVSRALRLICSAPVPGLNGSSFFDVLRTLTESSSWTHHIYLYGGLVRDILRRKVGFDLDVNFSAPATELFDVCQRKGYKSELRFDGEYLLIGDDANDVYIEGFAITHNPPQSHTADFSMNQLFYDFENDVIIDKFGDAVPSVAANRCEIPCPRAKWPSWLQSNGSRVLFRFYKFLLRGCSYAEPSLAYVAQQLMQFWARDEQETISIGRTALGDLVGSSDSTQLEFLQGLVFKSFDLAQRDTPPVDNSDQKTLPGFLSASDWWRHGWLRLLQPAGAAKLGG